MRSRTRLLVFVAVFCIWTALLQWTAGLQAWYIEHLTVPAAVWLINVFLELPAPALAAGARIVAPGGGINVLQGCEGLDVLGLWIAAVAAGALTWRGRWLGWSIGVAIVFALNLGRLISLFDLYRHRRDWFGDAHGLWWPLALVALVFALFVLWQRWFAAPQDDAVPT